MEKKQKILKPSIQDGNGIGRRNFLVKSVLAGAGLAVAPFANSASQEIVTTSHQLANKKRKLGTLEVSSIGLGCMSMTSGHYNPPRAFNEMAKVIQGAVDQGITLFDTAEYYGPFTNEEVVGQALKAVRNKVVIASKFGFQFENGKPTANPEDFVTGFIVDEEKGEVYGRPVGVAVMPDGALLINDDKGNVLWRVAAK